jgi:hypothetical protein
MIFSHHETFPALRNTANNALLNNNKKIILVLYKTIAASQNPLYTVVTAPIGSTPFNNDPAED